MEPREEIAQLTKELERHNHLYYVLDNPEIPDYEYDRMLRRLEELKAGNGEFANAAQETLGALNRMELPEVSYFLEHFGDTFGLTLDQLNEGENGK